MTPEERLRLARAEFLLEQLVASDRYTFHKDIQMFDGRNIQTGLTTGTKIGTSALDKIGFFGAAPVAQQANISAPSSPGLAYDQTEAQSAVAAINSIRTALDNLGLTA